MRIDSSWCIGCVATGIYVKGQDRLKRSLEKVGYSGDVLFFADELPQGALSQEESPMGYKSFAIREAINKGYKKILWLDANMVCIRNPKTIFKKIEQAGYYFWYPYSEYLSQTCSEFTLEKLGVSKVLASSIPDSCAACVGINAENDQAVKFLEEWLNLSLDGVSYRGYSENFILANNGIIDKTQHNIENHKFDQPVSSYLIWKYKLRRFHCEVKNIQSRNSRGENVYSRALSLKTEIVQSRDTKGEKYLKDIDKWINNKGIAKMKFVLLSIADTVLRYYKYIKNEYKLRRQKI